MRAMTRQELADKAGVTTRTLKNWMKPHLEILWEMGMRPYDILQPNVVAWLSERFGINIDD
jgi:hypothetical protein